MVYSPPRKLHDFFFCLENAGNDKLNVHQKVNETTQTVLREHTLQQQYLLKHQALSDFIRKVFTN